MALKQQLEAIDTSKDGNRLLDSLPSGQRNGFLAQCDLVELAFGEVLCEAGQPFKYAYFPIAGNISLVKTLVGHEPFETESIGSEGMLGTSLILSVNRAPQRGVVLAPCPALRISAQDMRLALKSYPALLAALQRYLYVVLVELLQTTGCVRYHDVGKRLARVLLVAHDRSQDDNISLTHMLLADMLGVQRGAVTIAATKLQREGIIRYSRGKISILDRDRLEASSCECYRASIEKYSGMLSQVSNKAAAC